MHLKRDTQNLSETGSRLTQLMLQAVVSHSTYPSQMFMTEDIQWESDYRVGGSFGDIYLGRYQGQDDDFEEFHYSSVDSNSGCPEIRSPSLITMNPYHRHCKC